MKVQRLTRSLLRYPGSKARLAPLIAEIISANKYNEYVFAEPFCGGASVSIALLESGVVEKIALNDVDPLIACLWKSVFSNSAKSLADAITNIPIDLKQWDYQKSLVPTDTLSAAIKCLFLNRTSFSGILKDNAGPIGGRSQEKWSLGCRLNREKLASRILQLSELSDKVLCVENLPWDVFCANLGPQAFLYIDPPFFHKADRLYRHVFGENDHIKLRNFVVKADRPLVLSYDNAKEIREIYSLCNLNVLIIDNTYAAHPAGGNSYIGRELLYSNVALPGASGKVRSHTGISVRALDDVLANRIMRIRFSDILKN